MSLSIHDNFVTSYEVRCSEREIVIRTEYRDAGEPSESTDAVFRGVQGYLFRDGLSGILFGIEEVSVARIHETFAKEIAAGRTRGWPWSQDLADSAESLSGFLIQGQTAFDGFVVAQSMALEARA
ncbi:MAG: hypothetical protein AAF517_19600 [Planctomycetota bacterium]